MVDVLKTEMVSDLVGQKVANSDSAMGSASVAMMSF